jgi:serine/threonine protein kinase
MQKTEIMTTATATEQMPGLGTEIVRQGGEDSNFTGSMLKTGDAIEGWKVTSKLNIESGEAELYRAKKGKEEGIIKYYRSYGKPKTDILDRIQGLRHEDIVHLYKYGEHNGHLYEIMEYAAGGALDSKNDDGSYKYLPLSEDALIDVCKETINAFKTCHDLGIIHRDIKPANLYYRGCSETPNEQGKYTGIDLVIADFGISSIKKEDEEQFHRTRNAARTSAYAAPEIQTEEINAKFDYYSLGITLWELAMGKMPFADEHGRQLEPIVIMQRASYGMAADDLLSVKPLLSEKMQRLIRGLLVLDTEHRWGYEEVTAHLEGKHVELAVKKDKISFKIGDTTATTIEELAKAILDNPKEAHKYIYNTSGGIKATLKAKFPKYAQKVSEIAEIASANNDYDNGIYKVAWTLSLEKAPFKPGNGYAASGYKGLENLIANAPETMLPLLRNKNSQFYAYLEVLGSIGEGQESGINMAAQQIKEIKAIAETAGDAELIAKTLVILANRIIIPYKLAKYKDFKLDTIENFISQKIPEDLQNRILLLIAEKSCDGYIYPWIDLHLKEKGIASYSPKTWQELINLFGKSAA